jgi:hypothetical protein
MEKWIVIGGIWVLVTASLVLFVRGASPARNRAQSMARLREKRLKAQVEAQVEAQEAGGAEIDTQNARCSARSGGSRSTHRVAKQARLPSQRQGGRS